MQKKIKRDWKFPGGWSILYILCAGVFLWTGVSVGEEPRDGKGSLEAENRRLKTELAFREAENAALRKELIETLDKYSTQAGQLKRVQMSAAGTIETLEPVYTGAREMELAADLKENLDAMKKMSSEAISLSDELDKTLPELVSDQVELTKLRIRIDSLRERALDLARMTSPPVPPGKFGACRILELDPGSKIAVLNGGRRDGLRAGMVLRSGEVVLKVLAVRNFVSAAAVLEGSFEDLAVGSEAKAGLPVEKQ